MNWSIIVVPLVTGALAFGYMWLQSRAYDRKHPRLHRPGDKPAESPAPIENPRLAMDEMPADAAYQEAMTAGRRILQKRLAVLSALARQEGEHRRQVDFARRVMRENRSVLSVLSDSARIVDSAS